MELASAASHGGEADWQTGARPEAQSISRALASNRLVSTAGIGGACVYVFLSKRSFMQWLHRHQSAQLRSLRLIRLQSGFPVVRATTAAAKAAKIATAIPETTSDKR